MLWSELLSSRTHTHTILSERHLPERKEEESKKKKYCTLEFFVKEVVAEGG